MMDSPVKNLSRPLRTGRVAELLGCTERMVRKMCVRFERDGAGPPHGIRCFRVGKAYRVTPEAVVEFRERRG